LNITHRQLLHAFNCTDLPYNPQTPPRQQPDNIQTRFPDKELLEAQQPQPFPTISTTGEFSYGTSKQGSTGTRGKVIPIDTRIRPEDQSVDEWLRDYGSGDAE
jgi:hypothetical protein